MVTSPAAPPVDSVKPVAYFGKHEEVVRCVSKQLGLLRTLRLYVSPEGARIQGSSKRFHRTINSVKALMGYMAIITTAGDSWKMSTLDGSLPISNKIGVQRRVPRARK